MKKCQTSQIVNCKFRLLFQKWKVCRHWLNSGNYRIVRLNSTNYIQLLTLGVMIYPVRWICFSLKEQRFSKIESCIEIPDVFFNFLTAACSCILHFLQFPISKPGSQTYKSASRCERQMQNMQTSNRLKHETWRIENNTLWKLHMCNRFVRLC